MQLPSFAQKAINHSVFTIAIDYTKTLGQMIEAISCGYVNESITDENFPFRRRVKADTGIILMHFNRFISTEDALNELGQFDLRPAGLPELLAFGETYPLVQQEFPIVALGSVWHHGENGCSVPYLDYWGAERKLRLGDFNSIWRRNDRFAAMWK